VEVLFAYADERTNLRWHHLLVQKHRENFKRAGLRIDIDQALLGWIMSHEDHTAITKDWEKEWDTFFRRNPTPSKKQVGVQLGIMMEMDEFKPHLVKGVRADKPHRQWNQLKKKEKSIRFKKLRRTVKFLGAILGSCCSAERAAGAFAPVMALGEEDALRDFENAMRALQKDRFREAEIALFGVYPEQGAGVLSTKNSMGLIPKMISKAVESEAISPNTGITAIGAAHKIFNDGVRNSRQ
jgi:hypothetical protein